MMKTIQNALTDLTESFREVWILFKLIVEQNKSYREMN